MGDITVKMIFNRETGKKDIWIDFESEEDALPHEHEKRHRQIIERLLGQGVLMPDEVGDIVVRRGAEPITEPEATPDVTPSAEPEKLGES